jgi:hypothetical protein
MRKTDPDREDALPVKLDSTSNGEYWPQPVDPAIATVNRSALEAAARRWIERVQPGTRGGQWQLDATR